MKIRKASLAAVSVALISSLLSIAGIAATHQDARERPFIRLSEDGSKAMRAISMARVAIFDGQEKEAVKLVDEAKATLSVAAKDADKLAIKKPSKSNSEPMIPVDAKLTMADDFILTPERREKIDKVNEHLRSGETGKAVELLKPADVQLTLTTLFMPVEATAKAVDQAAKLLTENKYYEANLALKKAEDGWVIDSQSFVDYLADLPKTDKPQASAVNASQPEVSPKPEKVSSPHG